MISGMWAKVRHGDSIDPVLLLGLIYVHDAFQRTTGLLDNVTSKLYR